MEFVIGTIFEIAVALWAADENAVARRLALLGFLLSMAFVLWRLLLG